MKIEPVAWAVVCDRTDEARSVFLSEGKAWEYACGDEHLTPPLRHTQHPCDCAEGAYMGYAGCRHVCTPAVAHA